MKPHADLIETTTKTILPDKATGRRKEVEGEQRSLPQCSSTELSFKNSKWLSSKVKCSPLRTSGTEWPVIRAEGSGVQSGIDGGLGVDAGEDRYVTYETLQKPFSQVSQSRESGTEI